jgi:hypothetical protein
MEEDIKRYEKQIIMLRKQLADLEIKRSQYQSNIPSEIWQELANVSHQLEQAEQKVKRFTRRSLGTSILPGPRSSHPSKSSCSYKYKCGISRTSSW